MATLFSQLLRIKTWSPHWHNLSLPEYPIHQRVLCSVQFSCSIMSNSCDPIDCSMPGFPVYHQLPELVQTHVHRLSDAIQPSHPLLSPSPPPFNPSQHQGLFQSVSSSHQVAKVFEFQLQHQSASASASLELNIPMNIQGWFPLGLTGWISLQSKGLSRVFSNTTVQKHQFFHAQLYL